MEDFEKTILGYTSDEHSEREFADRSLELMKTHDPVTLSRSLLEVMSKDEHVSAHLAAVLYRKVFIETFNPDQDPSAKEKLIHLIQPFKSLRFLKKVADILVILANHQSFSNEILSLATLWTNSTQQNLKVLAFYMLEIAIEQPEMLKIIETNSCSVFEILWKGLSDSNDEIKLSSSTSACRVLISLKPTPEHWKLFSMILEGLQSFQTVEVFPVVSLINELIEVHPKIISGQVDRIVQVLGAIAKNSRADRSSRSSAVEVFTMMAKLCSGQVGKSRFFIQEALTLAMVLLSELDFPLNLQEWNSNLDDGVALLEPFDVGQELLSAISDNLQELVFNDAIVLIDAHLAAPHWIYQHSGLIALGVISEGCRSSLFSLIPKYIEVIFSYCKHENPRLRHASIFCLSLFCTYFSPELQETYHPGIVAALLSNLQPGQLFRVTAQALKGIINYCSALKDSDLIDPYLTSLITAYESLLGQPSTPVPVLQALLNSLSIVIKKSSSSEPFNSFLPKLLKIFYLPGIQVEDLKLDAMICVGRILEKNKFEDNSQVFDEILRIKATVHENETHYNKILDIICKKVIFTRDSQLLSDLMEELLRNAQIPVEVAVFDTDTVDSNLLRGIVLELNGLGRKKISLNTSAIEIKKTACRILNLLVREVQEQTQPWMFKILTCMKSLVDFKINPEIRKFALETIVAVFHYAEKSAAQEMLLNVFPELFALIQVKTVKFHQDARMILKAVLSISKKVADLSLFGLQGAAKLSEILNFSIKSVVSRKEKRLALVQSIKTSDPGSKELKKQQKHEKTDDEILKTCVDLIGILLKSFKSGFLPIFQQFFQELVGELLYKQEPSIEDLSAGLVLFSYYVEHTGDLMLINENSLILEELVKFAYHQAEKVRKSAVHTIGLAAIHGARGFSRYLQASIEACNFLIGLPEAFSDRLIASTECAVAALGKIAVTYRDDLIPVWLKFLPLKTDLKEATVTKELFFKHFEKIKRFECAVEVSRIFRNEVMV